jgi:hypothetical protein
METGPLMQTMAPFVLLSMHVVMKGKGSKKDVYPEMFPTHLQDCLRGRVSSNGNLFCTNGDTKVKG